MKPVVTSSAVVTRPVAWSLLAVVIVLWGANWPVMKYGLGYISPLWFAATRMLLGALTMALVAAALGKLEFPRRGDWPVVLSVGLLQMAAFLGLVTVALQYVPAGRSAILAYTTSLWVVPLAMLLLGERVDARKLAGFLLGLLGVLVMFNPFGFDWSDPQVIIGNGLLLVAAFCWALLIIQVRGTPMQGSPLSLAPWQFLVASMVLVPVAVVMEGSGHWHWGVELAWVLLYNGPLATALCFWAMISITRALPASTTSVASLGVPVFGLLASAVALAEPLTLTNSVGLVLILVGLLNLTLADRAGQAPTEPVVSRVKE
ncbi:MAG: DMT family transporter [Ectothiorhodospiraceae bacterium]|nr:DMT family transporter [Ectothiorhodospiraceae bacterium]